jgi:hypothetical protein
VITGSEYELHGRTVRVVAAWNGKANPQLPELQAALPLVSTRPGCPRNVMYLDPETGRPVVRPFRGLRKTGGAA